MSDAPKLADVKHCPKCLAYAQGKYDEEGWTKDSVRARDQWLLKMIETHLAYFHGHKEEMEQIREALK